MNKKQHFVPAGFLRNFSDDPTAGRAARVFVFDASTSFVSSVGDLCVQGDYYTSDRHREFAVHGQIDSELSEVVNKLLAGDRAPRNLMAMLYHASYLQVRGSEFDNASMCARLDAAQRHGITHYCQHILQIDWYTLGRISGQEAAKLSTHIARTQWDFAVIQAAATCKEPDLICSDCPTLAFTTDGRPDMVILPLSPSHLYVAVRCSELRIASQDYTDDDASWANAAQCYFSHRHVFSRRPLTPTHQRIAARLMTQRQIHSSKFEDGDLIISTYKLPENLPSFISRRAA